jgi:hypothetical protein
MESIGSGPFLAFGFTSIILEKIIRELMSLNLRIPINEGLLFHGGGWKRIESKFGSDSIEFKAKVREFLGIHRIHDYYGMAEQAGSIFVECGHGYFHASNFSDVIFRDPNSLEVQSPGGVGLIQVLSVLPLSYPGHSILTEDLGHFLGEDDCHCGRLGKYFKVIGRVPKSEIRGCSDASDF